MKRDLSLNAEHLHELSCVGFKFCVYPDDAHHFHAVLKFPHVELMLFFVAYRLIYELPVVTVDVLEARALDEQEAVEVVRNDTA